MRKSLFTLSIILLFGIVHIYAQSPRTTDNKKILVLGSSVASGWVTSYEEKYDLKNGYAYRLQRYLMDKGFDVINKSIPGDDTRAVLARFEEDVLSEDPDYLIIGLSMANEGLETENPDSVSVSFESGMKEIIQKCEENEIYPVIGLCYANDNFTPVQYGYLKKMNIKLNSLGYPCINFLGAFEDGMGHFPAGFTFDPNHPDDRGHEEFYLAVNPGLFDALKSGIPLPEYVDHNTFITLGDNEKLDKLWYYPTGLMHSFSFGFEFQADDPGVIAQIQLDDQINDIILDDKLKLIYKAPSASIYGDELQQGKWYQFMLTHRYLDQSTLLYIDGKLIGKSKEKIEPLAFNIGGNSFGINYKNLMIYRATLNQDEIGSLTEQWIHASLASYAPFQNGSIENKAQNNSVLVYAYDDIQERKSASLSNIEIARTARANELIVEHKNAIRIDPEILPQYAGKYKISEDDYFIVEVEEDKIFFIDRDQKGEILPESENVFFIKYPGEITFTFEKDETGKVVALIANFNGYKISASRDYN